MNIQKLIQILTDAGIDENEAKKEIEILLEHFCSYTPKDIVLGKELTNSEYEMVREKANERAVSRMPIQYITGQAWFMGEYFKVNPSVLIPRSETEILVTEAIKIIKENGFTGVLDLCTGSGCIACSIAKATSACVLGTDISSDALRTALDNVTNLGINNRAVFRKSDLFEKIRSDEVFDLIVSNPPYIPHGTSLAPELSYEPRNALFAEDNGLVFYKKIIKDAPKHLKAGGFIMFELGAGEADEVKKLMDKSFDSIFIIKDLAGIERVIAGRKTG